jgi:putative transposase
MARKPRIQFPGAFYHIYNRGNRREPLYLDSHDYENFEKFLWDAVSESKVSLYDWALIPNHFHLSAQTPQGNLSHMMSSLLTRYAMYFNRRHKMVGHVFQGRYGARLCDKEEYFLALLQYIELNPYRLKNGGMLALPGEWKWTALRFLMGKEEIPEVCRQPFEEVLMRFGKTPEAARLALSRFLAEGLNNTEISGFFEPGSKDILGDNTFIDQVDIKIQETETIRFISLLNRAAEHFKITSAELCDASQGRKLTQIRNELIYIAKTDFGLMSKEIADGLLRSQSAISMALRRMTAEERDGIKQSALRAILNRSEGNL